MAKKSASFVSRLKDQLEQEARELADAQKVAFLIMTRDVRGTSPPSENTAVSGDPPTSVKDTDLDPAISTDITNINPPQSRASDKPPPPQCFEILEALSNCAKDLHSLARLVHKSDEHVSRSYIRPLIKSGKIKHARGYGYYRPDAPPPNMTLT